MPRISKDGDSWRTLTPDKFREFFRRGGQAWVDIGHEGAEVLSTTTIRRLLKLNCPVPPTIQQLLHGR